MMAEVSARRVLASRRSAKEPQVRTTIVLVLLHYYIIGWMVNDRIGLLERELLEGRRSLKGINGGL